MSTAVRKDDGRPKDAIPDVIADPSSGKRYLKGRFLGKVTCLILFRLFLGSVKRILPNFACPFLNDYS